MRRLVLWWLARQGVSREWVTWDLRAAAQALTEPDDYGRIPQTLSALARALSPTE